MSQLGCAQSWNFSSRAKAEGAGQALLLWVCGQGDHCTPFLPRVPHLPSPTSPSVTLYLLGGQGDGDAFVLLFSPAPICLNPSLALQPHPCLLGDSVLRAAEGYSLAPQGLHQALWKGFWTYLCMLCQT